MPPLRPLPKPDCSAKRHSKEPAPYPREAKRQAKGSESVSRPERRQEAETKPGVARHHHHRVDNPNTLAETKAENEKDNDVETVDCTKFSSECGQCRSKTESGSNAHDTKPFATDKNTREEEVDSHSNDDLTKTADCILCRQEPPVDTFVEGEEAEDPEEGSHDNDDLAKTADCVLCREENPVGPSAEAEAEDPEEGCHDDLTKNADCVLCRQEPPLDPSAKGEVGAEDSEEDNHDDLTNTADCDLCRQEHQEDTSGDGGEDDMEENSHGNDDLTKTADCELCRQEHPEDRAGNENDNDDEKEESSDDEDSDCNLVEELVVRCKNMAVDGPTGPVLRLLNTLRDRIVNGTSNLDPARLRRRLFRVALQRYGPPPKLILCLLDQDFGGRIHVDTPDENGATMLFDAIQYDRTETGMLLVEERGANVNALDKNGETPLHWAVHWHRAAWVEYLLDQGANVDAADKDGTTPLHKTVKQHHQSSCDVARILLDHSANVNAQDNNGKTPLHKAVKDWRVFFRGPLSMLLDRGAAVNATDNDGLTPLHDAAALCGSQDIDILLSRGANIHAADRQGNTPLLSVPFGRIFAEDKKTRTGAWWARMLIGRGANVNAFNLQGRTVAHLVAINVEEDDGDDEEDDDDEEEEEVEEGEEGEDHNGGEGDANLNDGCEGVLLLRFLVDHGADLAHADSDGKTVLHCAAESGKARFVETLLHSGANAEARDTSNLTPLFHAARSGNKDLVHILVQRTAATPG